MRDYSVGVDIYVLFRNCMPVSHGNPIQTSLGKFKILLKDFSIAEERIKK